ncbi:beta strand repeat-containing protein, partial [Celerinatantimonas diazotrophica]
MEPQAYQDVTPSSFTRKSVVGVLLYTLTVQPVLAAVALPTGGSVAAGQVSIGTSGHTTTVTQHSDQAIVNWQSFSVGKGASVHFIQPGRTAAILNRVTGATTSTIAGSIHANGQVYLINPNGIAITSTGSVKVGGGFVGSTLNITDKDFLKGHFLFKGTGASAGVSNAGIITVGRGGYAALIGGRVTNSGLIAAPLGRIGVGAGEEATLNLSGDGFLQVALPSKTDANGQDALIANSGTLSAHGGTVLISVASARDAARHVVNLSGVVEANSVSGHDGRIIIGGGQGGDVTVSGQVTATSATGKGGEISVTGQHIAMNGATIDASGATGGGSVKIGGDYQGKGDTQRAKTTTVNATSVIRANANQSGKGGQVVVWSNNLTTFDGQISARGAGAGKGGNAEVSGKATLAYNGVTDLSGPGGFGTLLLDPYNITISNGTASNSNGTSATGDDSVMNVTTLQTALNKANVAITTGSAGSQAGDITVANNVTWSSGSTLELSAYHNINVNAALTGGTGSKIVLRADNSGTGTGTVTFASNAKATAPGGVAIYYNPSSYTSATDYSGNMGSDTTATAYMLVNTLANLQAINTNLAGTYALSKDIDASATSSWNSGAGFVPLGGDSNDTDASSFTGSLDGQSHVISNLTIHHPSTNDIGLFGWVGTSGTIRNIGLEGGSISGKNGVGSLAGENDGTISNAYATGTVMGNHGVGGLVGVNAGTISNAYATGGVTGNLQVGGLTGGNIGDIKYAYATGAVSGGEKVGGFVGLNYKTISNVYATGAVTGNSNVGGLVGVSGSDATITSSYWDIGTTGQTSSSGGAGLTTAQMRDSANHSSNYSNWDFTDTWYQTADMRPILCSEAASPNADGVITVSNLHQLALINTNLSGTYQLTRNIDASATNAASDTYSASSIWGSGGFVPVGDAYNNRFTGTFDGQSHVISNLTINRPSTNDVGLFGYVGSGGTIRNIGLEGGSISGQRIVGGLVGENEGTISNAYATGAVTGSDSLSSLVGYVGGLVGHNIGKISNAYATGAVTGSSGVGGLVGWNDGSLSNAYATGAVTGSSYGVGGLVGFMYGTISNAYAIGAVTGSSDSVGGLVGINHGTISNAYATGAVKGTGANDGFVGGLVGYNGSNATITSSYWDMGTTGKTNAVGNVSSVAGATGLTTAEMKDPSNFSGFDWTIWAPADASHRPELYGVSGVVGYVGSMVYGATSPTITTYGAGVWNTVSGAPVISGEPSATSNVGTYTGNVSGVSGTFMGGGATRFVNFTNVTPADLTVKATGSQSYGSTSPTYEFSASGWENGQGNSNLTGLSYTTTATATSNVSKDYTAMASGGTLSGAAKGNYTLHYKAGEFDVNPADLTVTAKDVTKTYGDAVTFNGTEFTVSPDGLKNNETIGKVTLASAGAVATANVTKSPYVINASNASGGTFNPANYTITYVPGKLTVKKAPLKVTASGHQSYGSTSPTYKFSASGWANGQGNSNLTGLSYTTTATAKSNVGKDYTAMASDGTLSGAAKGNYTLHYEAGEFDVNPADLTVTAKDVTKTYGDVVTLKDTDFTVSPDGLK